MEQVHNITKLELELHIPAGGYASAARETVARICREDLLPSLNRLFDSWAGPAEFIFMERLEITVTAKSVQQLEQELVREIIKKINQQYDPGLNISDNSLKIIRTTYKRAQFDHWIHFLRHGLLPHSPVQVSQSIWEQDILETLATEVNAKQSCSDVLKQHPQAVERLVAQFDPSFFKSWIAAYAGHDADAILQLSNEWQEILSDTTLIQWVKEKLPGFSQSTWLNREIRIWLVQQLIHGRFNRNPGALLNELGILSFGAKNWREIVKEFYLFLQAMQPVRNVVLFAIREWTHYNLNTDRDTSINLSNPDLGSSELTPPDQMQAGLAEKEFIENNHRNENLNTNTLSKSNDQLEAEFQTRDKELFQFEKIFPDQELSKKLQEEVAGPVYITNAGLVILHPYLYTLFDSLNLLENNAFKTPVERDRAVQLLCYLAHGEEALPEQQLVLPKLLCGMLPAQPVNRFIVLSDGEKAEADLLLKAVIEHWKALKSTSPDGLRGNFLLREGKLEWTNNEWRLRVTQLTYDILLERLPWSISIIKLPWMLHFLKTEWV